MDETKLRDRLTFTCDALTALGILGSLHLALKHPLNTGPSTRLVKAFYEQLTGKLGAIGLLSAQELRETFDMAEVDHTRQETQRLLRQEGEF